MNNRLSFNRNTYKSRREELQAIIDKIPATLTDSRGSHPKLYVLMANLQGRAHIRLHVLSPDFRVDIQDPELTRYDSSKKKLVHVSTSADRPKAYILQLTHRYG